MLRGVVVFAVFVISLIGVSAGYAVPPMVDFAIIDEQTVGDMALPTCPLNQTDPCFVEIPMSSGIKVICIFPYIDWNQCDELNLVGDDIIFVTGFVDAFHGDTVVYAQKIYKK